MNDKLPVTRKGKRNSTKKTAKTATPDKVVLDNKSDGAADAIVSPKKDESMKEKIILGIINTFLISGFLALIGQQFTSLKKFEDVKFEKEQIECLTENCDTARQRFLVFRLGENSINNVSFNLKITNPDYEIINGTQSVKQFEKSLFLSTERHNADGNEIDYQDPELNQANSFGFKVNQLSPHWIYELKFDVKTKGDKSFSRYGIFQIIDGNGNQYNHQNRSFYDYLRLYLIEALVISIIFAIILGIVIWFIGKYYFITRRRGELN